MTCFLLDVADGRDLASRYPQAQLALVRALLLSSATTAVTRQAPPSRASNVQRTASAFDVTAQSCTSAARLLPHPFHLLPVEALRLDRERPAGDRLAVDVGDDRVDPQRGAALDEQALALQPDVERTGMHEQVGAGGPALAVHVRDRRLRLHVHRTRRVHLEEVDAQDVFAGRVGPRRERLHLRGHGRLPRHPLPPRRPGAEREVARGSAACRSRASARRSRSARRRAMRRPRSRRHSRSRPRARARTCGPSLALAFTSNSGRRNSWTSKVWTCAGCPAIWSCNAPVPRFMVGGSDSARSKPPNALSGRVPFATSLPCESRSDELELATAPGSGPTSPRGPAPTWRTQPLTFTSSPGR